MTITQAIAGLLLLLHGPLAHAQEATDKLKSSSDKAQDIFERGDSNQSDPEDSLAVFELSDLDTVPAPPINAPSIGQCSSAIPDSTCAPNSKVFVSFIVERDGSCSEIQVVGHACALFDSEAICLIEHWVPWIPGYRKGRRVRARVIMPVLVDSF